MNLGKIQKTVLKDLLDHPDRFIKEIYTDDGQYYLTMSDTDNDYYDINRNSFLGLYSRDLIESTTTRPSINVDIIKSRINPDKEKEIKKIISQCSSIGRAALL